MERPTHSLSASRVLFESLEERLALSIDPAADFWLDQQALEIAVEPHDRRIEAHETPVSVARLASGVAQDFGLSGRGQTAVVIDSGIAYDHVALGGGLGSGYRVVGGWDFAENDANPYDDGPAGFHGTHVAGIIGAKDSRYGGLASQVDLVALRVFDDQGNGYFSWVEQALKWVHERRSSFANPITTVNLSLGAEWNSASIPSWATLEDEFRQLEQDGIFVAVSAGNSFQQYNATGLSYPAVSQYVVPVASVDASGNLSRFSQRDARVLAAPGERITSTVPDHYYGGDGLKNDFGAASGTSMAAPYVAGASVLVRQAMLAMGQTLVTQDGIYELLRNTADVVYDSATSASYRRVNLQRALDTLVGPDDAGDAAAMARSLGSLTSTLIVSGTIGRTSDSDYFQFTAGQSGTVTLNVTTTGELSPRWLGDAAGAGNRAAMNVIAGKTYAVGLATAGGIGRYTLNVQMQGSSLPQNIVIGPGGQVDVYGTAGDDSLAWSGGANAVIVVNGATHSLPNASQVRFHGLGGSDSIQILGTSAAETATLRTGSLTFTGAGFTVTADSVETIHVLGGVSDQAILYDSSGNDYFDAGPTSGLMRGDGFYHHVERFGAVSAYASSGGFDVARLYDSPGNDYFDAGPTSGVLRGRDFYLAAGSFDELHASASAGGYDRARLYDSGGNDWFDAGPTSGLMRGSGYYNQAEHFDEVNAYALWGGYDLANLYGSLGNDRLELRGTSRILVGADYRLRAEQFDQVRSFGQGGIDQALLYDLGSQDQFYGRRNFGRLTAAAVATELFDFDSALAYDRAGQRSQADVQALEYVFRRLGG